MNFNHTWALGCLMRNYIEELKTCVNQYQKNEAEDRYAEAAELTVKENCGFIMPINMFIRWVDDGSLIDYDGMGYLLDAAGERTGYSRCDVAFLEKAKKNGTVFIAWYNK